MKTRKMRDLTVSEIGMGCMAFSHGYGQIPPEDYSVEAIRNAYRHGCALLSTALIWRVSGITSKALSGVRNNVVLATKLFVNI